MQNSKWRTFFKNLADIFVVGLILGAGYMFTSALHYFLHSILDQSVTSPVVLQMFELLTLIAVSVFSTFGYFHSIKTEPEPEQANKQTGDNAALILNANFRRRLIRIFSAANLLSIAGAAYAVAHHDVFYQVMAIAVVYLLFCGFGFIVVLNNNVTHERHYHFKWLREENVASLCVFVTLALIVVLHKALSTPHPISEIVEGNALHYITFFVGGASMFHVGSSTMKYFYATLLEEDHGHFWMLTSRGCGSAACPAGAAGGQFVDINNIIRRTRQDLFLVIILFSCGLLIWFGWEHFPLPFASAK